MKTIWFVAAWLSGIFGVMFLLGAAFIAWNIMTLNCTTGENAGTQWYCTEAQKQSAPND